MNNKYSLYKHIISHLGFWGKEVAYGLLWESQPANHVSKSHYTQGDLNWLGYNRAAHGQTQGDTPVTCQAP